MFRAGAYSTKLLFFLKKIYVNAALSKAKTSARPKPPGQNLRRRLRENKKAGRRCRPA
jgi:hypothetical protein